MPTLPDVPELILGDLVELRAPAVEHTDAVGEAVRESLPELKVWMPWATDDYDREGAELSLRRAVAAFVTRDDLRYQVFEAGTERFLGSTGLHRIKWSVPRFEIGYWLRTSATGRGYVTDAVRALTRTAFERLGAKRVEIRCDDRNAPSAAVAERCGFALEGVLANFSVGTDGTVRDERVYALTDLSDLR
jgi:RimJ/RimL family protein N-acetyltransferase